eukprot:SAG31_NODE_42617_length_270_cov_1.771930_1_plen_20_part_01
MCQIGLAMAVLRFQQTAVFL